MKKFQLLILMITLLMACNKQERLNGKKYLEINKDWEFREYGQSEWLPATVPGTVHTDLMNNKIIDDPYYRLNELSVQWIDKTDWEYRCHFEAGQDLSGYQQYELVFDGLDTYADIFLNDSLILKADNMFRNWRVDCGNLIKTGKNELRIILRSPTKEGLARMESYGLALPAGNDQSERGGMGDKRVSPFVRKAPYHFGWDWGPRLVTSGIWRRDTGPRRSGTRFASTST